MTGMFESMEDETCPVCGRVDIPAYQCFRVGHLPAGTTMKEFPSVAPHIPQLATFQDYEAEVERTAAGLQAQNLPILGLGLAGEAGEAADIIKKVFGHGHQMTPEVEKDLVNEIGDLMWYCVAVLRTLGVPMQEALQRNVDKLRRRYPEGFSTEASLKRVDMEEK